MVRLVGVRGLGRLGGRLGLWMLRTIFGLGLLLLLVLCIVVASGDRERESLGKKCERMVIRKSKSI